MKRIILFLAFLGIFAASALAQVERYTDTLKVNTTASFIIDFAELDSMHLDLAFPDSASGRVRVKALANINGKLTAIATDTAMVKWFGPNAGASNVRVSWMEIKDSVYCNTCGGKLPRWQVMPTKFYVEVIFFNDAATYGGFTDQAVKKFLLTVRKFRRLAAGVLPYESYTDTLKRSTTFSTVIDIADIDSAQFVFSYADSASGRIRMQAYNSITGVGAAVTGDTLMAQLIMGKNIGGGQTRVSWAQTAAFRLPGGVMPDKLQVDAIFDATVTASGLVRPVKLVQLDVRKFRHK